MGLITHGIGDLAGIDKFSLSARPVVQLSETEMTTRPWYPFFWSDYSGKTMHLSQGQHGAYMLFLRWIYTTGKPIPHKQRYSLAIARLEQERSDADLVLGEFFIRKDDNWHSQRAEEVIQDTELRHNRFVEAGKKGAEHRYREASREASRVAIAPTTITIPTEEERKKVISEFRTGGNGTGNGFTVQNPSVRLAKFHNWLAPKLNKDLKVAWNVIAMASDPSIPGYAEAKETCRLVAIQNGKKGLPPQW